MLATTPNLPAATGAAVPLQGGLDALLSLLPQEHQETAALFGMIGAANALNLTRAYADVSFLLKLQEIKQTEAYAALPSKGKPLTWEEFCRLLPGRPARRTIDERLAELDDLGAEFMQLAGEVGLGRKTLRVLRSVDADALPRLLESGEVEFPDGRKVPLDADHQPEIREALEDLAVKRSGMTEQRAAGMDQVRELSGELTKARNELVEAQRRAEAAQLSPTLKQYAHAYREVRLLVETVMHEQPERDLVLRLVNQLNKEHEALLEYALAARPDYDPDEMADALNDLEQA